MVVSSQRSSTQMHNKHCNSSPRQHNGENPKSKNQIILSSTLRIVLLHTGSVRLSKLMRDPSVCIYQQHTFTTHERPFLESSSTIWSCWSLTFPESDQHLQSSRNKWNTTRENIYKERKFFTKPKMSKVNGRDT